MMAFLHVAFLAHPTLAHIARLLACARKNGMPPTETLSVGAKIASPVSELRLRLRGFDWRETRIDDGGVVLCAPGVFSLGSVRNQ
jgi:hypothetical protein